MISIRMSLTASLVFLLFILGVVAQNGWGVTYKHKSVCALKGSAVTIECTYTYPSGYSVTKAFWTKDPVTSGSEAPDLEGDPDYKDRFQYHGDERRDCTFRLKDVREKDKTKYYFRFITEPEVKYEGEGGVDLSVTALQVEVSGSVVEGGHAILTCKTTCSLTVTPAFSWYRNGISLPSSTDQVLHLQSFGEEHTGRYHCAVLGQKSPEVTLNLKSPQVEVSGSVVEGGHVTLTCKTTSSLTVTPAFTWYRNGISLPSSTDQVLHLQSLREEDTGSYHCAVLGQKSPEVPIKIK
ncbi:hypothetical protein NFI96_023843 [Prochilodus magdalenae]|nr:hypothetical protein NFI96_023843 [Prochilodus magdalenae]